VGGYHTNRAPGLDSLDKLSQATGNAQAPDRESLRHACIWKATSMLFWRYKVAYEKSRNIRRNMASVAELKKSFFAEIDKVENREDLEKQRVKYLGREKGILTAVLRSLGGMPLAKRKELGPQAQELKREVEKLLSNRMVGNRLGLLGMRKTDLVSQLPCLLDKPPP
jgi:Aminoacyl tRNA synthetase class II, N-terminal domain